MRPIIIPKDIRPAGGPRTAENGKKGWLTPTIFTLLIMSVAMGSLEFSVIGIMTELSDYFFGPGADAKAKIGLLVTAFAIGSVIGTPVVLILTAKINRFKIMFVGMIILTVLTFTSSTIATYEIMMVNRFIMGVVSGVTVSCSYAMCAEVPPPEQRPQAMSFVYAGHSVASALIIPIVETIAHHTSWQWSYALILALHVVSVVLIIFFVPKNALLWNGTKQDQIGLFKDKCVLLGMFAPVLSVAGVYMVYSYITPIFETGFGIPEKYLYIFLFVFGTVTIIGNIISSYVESHGGMKALKYVFAAQAGVLLLVSFAIVELSDDLWLVGVTVMMLVGVIMYILNTPIQSYYIRAAKADYPGAANLSACFQSIAFNLGVTVGSIVGGAVMTNGAMGWIGVVGACFTVGAIAVLLVLEHVSRGRLLSPDIQK